MKINYKKIIFLLVAIFIISNSYAQLFMARDINTDKYITIDSTLYEISYSLKTIAHLYTGVKEPTEDICILQIGNKVSKSFSLTMYENDSVCTALSKKGTGTLPSIKKIIVPIEIYKNYSKNNYCTTTYRTFGQNSPILLYEKEQFMFDWEIIYSEKKMILGYQCIKATTSFRGRKYEAWYTPSIPIFDGPWKFKGLPGLIMQIQDSDKQYVFECIGLKNTEKKLPIKFWDISYKKVNREEYMKILKRMYKSPKIYLESVGSKIIGKNSHLITFPFNELELE